jgi:hypothetical protein
MQGCICIAEQEKVIAGIIARSYELQLGGAEGKARGWGTCLATRGDSAPDLRSQIGNALAAKSQAAGHRAIGAVIYLEVTAECPLVSAPKCALTMSRHLKLSVYVLQCERTRTPPCPCPAAWYGQQRHVQSQPEELGGRGHHSNQQRAGRRWAPQRQQLHGGGATGRHLDTGAGQHITLQSSRAVQIPCWICNCCCIGDVGLLALTLLTCDHARLVILSMAAARL